MKGGGGDDGGDGGGDSDDGDDGDDDVDDDDSDNDDNNDNDAHSDSCGSNDNKYPSMPLYSHNRSILIHHTYISIYIIHLLE